MRYYLFDAIAKGSTGIRLPECSGCRPGVPVPAPSDRPAYETDSVTYRVTVR